MKIAYLILCHIDPKHIARLANKISSENQHVYIHVDLESDIEQFKAEINNNNYVKFIKKRVKAYWGGFSAVKATINLMEAATQEENYDRFILLQGLDYPIVSNQDIMDFFERYKQVEFIRACNTTKSNDFKLYSKSKMFWFFDKKNFWRKCLNKINTTIKLKTRKGYIISNEKRYDVYWGCAQWALTGNCVNYILDFYDKNKKFNNYFKYVFPADETYFHSIVFNSIYANKTTNKGPEEENRELVNWRNLHYFEYPNHIRIFNENDYEFLKKQNCLFVRKTTTKDSTKLLDLIDINTK